MVFRDNHRVCPRCATALEETRTSLGHRFLQCQACNGQWVDFLILREMFHKLKPGRAMPHLSTRHDSEPELVCPNCSKPMQKRVMVTLALDQCEQHGVWFDSNELQNTLYTYALAD